MNKAYAIGTTMMVTMNGRTEEWTKLDGETWNTVGGTEGTAWVSWEKPDMVREAKQINKDLVKLGAKARGGDREAVENYEAAMDELDRVMDDLRLMDTFFPELAGR